MIEWLLGALFLIAGILVLYAVIRAAVRDGMVDAERRIEERRVRERQGVGTQRSPNSGRR